MLYIVGTFLPFSLALSFSLSLTHTHTHTQNNNNSIQLTQHFYEFDDFSWGFPASLQITLCLILLFPLPVMSVNIERENGCVWFYLLAMIPHNWTRSFSYARRRRCPLRGEDFTLYILRPAASRAPARSCNYPDWAVCSPRLRAFKRWEKEKERRQQWDGYAVEIIASVSVTGT